MNRMNEQLNEKRTNENRWNRWNEKNAVSLWLFFVVFVLFSLHFVAIEIERNNKEPHHFYILVQLLLAFHYITTKSCRPCGKGPNLTSLIRASLTLPLQLN